MNNPVSDTVSVRLTDEGRKAAGDGPLSVNGFGKPLSFKGSVAQTVSILTWKAVLTTTTSPAGTPLFEIVPASAAPAVTKTAEASAPNPAPAK